MSRGRAQRIGGCEGGSATSAVFNRRLCDRFAACASLTHAQMGLSQSGLDDDEIATLRSQSGCKAPLLRTRAAVAACRVAHLTPVSGNQIKRLFFRFQKLDKNETGFIT